MTKLFGSVGNRVGVWAPSSSLRARSLFRVHSALTHKSQVCSVVARKGVQEQYFLTMAQIFRVGLLAVIGSKDVTLYSLDAEKDLPTWLPTFTFK